MRVRFRLDSVDEGFNDSTGRLIDNVVLTGDCGEVGAGAAIFADDFESDDVDAWSGGG